MPVKLPDNIDLNVKGNPLDKQTKWKEIVIDGKKMIRETDTLDTFFDSSWYYLKFLSPKSDSNLKSELIEKWCPVHQYVGGIEHAVLHLLYSRFIVKALNSINEINIVIIYLLPTTKALLHKKLFLDVKKLAYE